MNRRPLIVHAIHRLGMGGLENGLVNLINHMPEERYRHAVLCMQGSTDFRQRIARENVDVYDMHCRQGRDPGLLLRIWRLFRLLKPAILHSRNMAGLDAVVPAMVAGVRCRIHGEHGRDEIDPDGENRRYRLVRRAYKPFVTHYVTVSDDLKRYMRSAIGINAANITQIYNGVDTRRFRPCKTSDPPISDAPAIFNGEYTVVGGIGRFSEVKNQMNLAKAYVSLLRNDQSLRATTRLVMIGSGKEWRSVNQYLHDAGVSANCWLPGARNDVPEIVRKFDVFVLPSIGEGISNTILEAMASGVAIVATRVGGNAELVGDGKTGTLVPPKNSEELASGIVRYIADASLRRDHGECGRRRALREFDLDVMVNNYMDMYDSQLA